MNSSEWHSRGYSSSLLSFFFLLVFYLRRKAIYLTHFVSAGVVWQNEICRPTWRVRLCRYNVAEADAAIVIVCVCVFALVCGNKIELQHILNINTNSVHCMLRRLTLLSDKNTIKHVCLRLHDELLPLAYSKENIFSSSSSLSTPNWVFSFHFRRHNYKHNARSCSVVLLQRSSLGRIFVICQNLSVEQRRMERTMCFFRLENCDGSKKISVQMLENVELIWWYAIGVCFEWKIFRKCEWMRRTWITR